MSDNQASATDVPPPAEAQVAADNARQGRYEDARGDLRRAQDKLVDLIDRRDEAASKIANAIRDKCDEVTDNLWENLQDGIHDFWNENFQEWMDDHAKLVKKVCSVLGYIAMGACVVALFVPGLNVLAAGVLMGVAVGATSASLIAHAALAKTGNGPWSDVGMDAIALATFGVGRFLGPGIKLLGKGKTFGGALERLTAETKIAGA